MIDIKVISDTHNLHDKFNSVDLECDILIHCGDACVKGNYSEGLAFLKWFVKQPAKYKIAVWGNHDTKLKKNTELIELAKEYGIITLNRRTVEVMGLKIHGNNTTFMDLTRGTVPTHVRQEAWESIPEGLDILVTHQPPHGILDANKNGVPIGCPYLKHKVNKVNPMVHLFGHCHEDRDKVVRSCRDKYIEDTLSVNNACLDENYQFEGKITRLVFQEWDTLKEARVYTSNNYNEVIRELK